MEILDIKKELAGNAYPGRGIVIGKSADGVHAVIAYFIMGRSENSRNRVFVETPDGIRTQAFDPSKMTDPSLQLYLIDTRLQLLLAMRKVRLEPDFFALLQKHTQKQLEHPFAPNDYQQKVQNIWRRLTPAQMREKASAVQKVALALPLN